MPLLDMPLEQLRKYEGINPRPGDFDAYWEEALAELSRVRADAVRSRADFQTSFADCYDLYFTGVRGARIYAKLIIPKNLSGPAPAVVNFHGYTASSWDWYDKLPYAAAGCVVAALDCRGQGGLSEDTGGVKGTTINGHIIRGLDGDKQDMLMRHMILDTAQLVRLVMDMPEVDASRVGVMGGSQGGGLSVACAALVPEVKAMAFYFPFLSDYKRVWEMDLAANAYAELRTYFRNHDPFHEREDEIFEQLGYIDVHHLAPRIRAKAFMAATLMDNICPPSTQFAVYNHIPGDKEILIYPDYGHEGLPHIHDRLFAFLTGNL